MSLVRSVLRSPLLGLYYAGRGGQCLDVEGHKTQLRGQLLIDCARSIDALTTTSPSTRGIRSRGWLAHKTAADAKS